MLVHTVIEEHRVRAEIAHIAGFYGTEFANLGVIGVRVSAPAKVHQQISSLPPKKPPSEDL